MRINEQCRWLERLTQKLMMLLTMSGDAEIALECQSVPELLETVGTDTAAAIARRGCHARNEVRDGNAYHGPGSDAPACSSTLVDNAAKASAVGQTVYLHAHDGMIEVTDEGCGIPADELPRITEPFYRADPSRSKRNGGIGLGLALCLEIARIHGVRLDFDSRPGQGTTARVVFSNE